MKRTATAGLVLALALAVFPAAMHAQQTTRVVGRVQDSEALKALGGVQVQAVGTSIGTLTGTDGRYELNVPVGVDSLSFTYIGYTTAVLPLAPVVNVSLKVEAVQISGIVVTSLGIEREQRDIPFAAQSVSGDRLTRVPSTNVISTLQGNVAGVHITNSSAPFGSARIVIRGNSSILGQNQPLIVIDGVPMDNSAASLSGYGGGSMNGYNIGNAASDIPADNIESVTVLKGPNAAALYGSRAANGAVVITTKNGRSGGQGYGLSATVSSNFETPLMLPAYQDQYGQGSAGEFDFVDGNGGGVNDYYDESFGPKLDGRTMGCMFQRDGNGDIVTDSNGNPIYDQSHPCNQFFGAGPWVAHPNNVRDFWNLGNLTNVNVAVTRASEQSNVRFSVGRQDEHGMYPNNRNQRTDMSLAGGLQISDKLSTEASIDYINDHMVGSPKQSYDESDPMQNFIWFGRQVDMNLLKNQLVLDPTSAMGQQIIAGNSWIRTDAPIPFSWNYSYHDNPYWQATMKKTDFGRNRLLGHASLNYQFNDWLSATGRAGRDWYQNHFQDEYPVNTVDDRDGSFFDRGETHSITTADLLIEGNRPLFQGLNVDVTAGAGLGRTNYNSNTGSVGTLVIPGVYTLENSAGQPSTNVYRSKKEVRSVYGQASFNYKNWFNVDVTGRNDWSSTLPKGNNSYFYPSVGAAFIFSDALGINSSYLSYGKLRASWTRVGNDTNPYQLTAVYGSGTSWAGQPTFTADNQLPNSGLKPEQTTGIEVGSDLGFWDNRVVLNLSWYKKTTKDQILPVSISNATGYTSAWVNSGEVENKGFEVEANVTPVQTSIFRWNVVANWSKNDNKVVSLYSGVDRVEIGNYWNVIVAANVGEPYGQLVGRKWERDSQGRIVVDAGGLPIRDPSLQTLGNYNPDWVGGLNNTFTYKNLSLSFLVDGQMGGNVYSVTKWFGDYAGVLKGTLAGRENDYNDPGFLVPNSVHEDGTPNTTRVLAQDYWEHTFYAQEMGIVDATYFKLRDARLAYNLPSNLVSRMGFSAATFAVVGHNLWIWTKQDIIDPETAFDTGNRQGVENAQLPTVRSIGFSLSIRP